MLPGKNFFARRIRKCLIAILCILMLISSVSFADPESFSSRRTLHSDYDPEQLLSEDQITSVLSAGFSMPTGGDQRALDFFVVTDRDIMKLMKGGNPWSQALDTAPCAIVVVADTDAAYYDELLEMDAGLAAGGILIQAADMGLASCVLSISPQEQRIQSVQSALNIPAGKLPILMITLGYPAVDSISSASVNNWSDSQVYWVNNQN